MQAGMQLLSQQLSAPETQCVHPDAGEKEAVKPKSDSLPAELCQK